MRSRSEVGDRVTPTGWVLQCEGEYTPAESTIGGMKVMNSKKRYF